MTMLCPTDKEVALAAAALRPRGDAWRNGGADALAGSVMGGFFDGLGAAAAPTHRRLCALVDEFFCSSATETLDLWQQEYGLPDACGPFVDICSKVNVVGDTTTDYAVAAAWRRGWSITIAEEWITVIEDCCAGMAHAGTAICGAENGVKWVIAVNRAASPAYQATDIAPPQPGMILSGDQLNCDPDIEPLRCLIRLIAPAHADLEFISL